MVCYDTSGNVVAALATGGCPPGATTTNNTSSSTNTGANTGANTGCPDPRVPDPKDAVFSALPQAQCSPCWNTCQQEMREREDACNVLRQRVALYLQGRGCPSNVTAAPMVNYGCMGYPMMGGYSGGYSAPTAPAQGPQAFSAPPRYRR